MGSHTWHHCAYRTGPLCLSRGTTYAGSLGRRGTVKHQRLPLVIWRGDARLPHSGETYHSISAFKQRGHAD